MGRASIGKVFAPSVSMSISTYLDAGIVSVTVVSPGSAPDGKTTLVPPIEMVPPSSPISATWVRVSLLGHSMRVGLAEDGPPSRELGVGPSGSVGRCSPHAPRAQRAVIARIRLTAGTTRRLSIGPLLHGLPGTCV